MLLTTNPNTLRVGVGGEEGLISPTHPNDYSTLHCHFISQRYIEYAVVYIVVLIAGKP